MTRALLADDHPFLCEGVKAVLEGVGIELVATEPDGEAALEAIARLHPDIAILDIRMPRRDGISTLQELRVRGYGLPVILLTAEMSGRQFKAANEAGVHGIVLKQSGSQMLAEAIKTVLAGGKVFPPELEANADPEGCSGQCDASGIDQLNPRELEIARAAGLNYRNREISEMFGVSEGAIKMALFRIYEKLGAKNRVDLALRLRALGVLDDLS